MGDGGIEGADADPAMAAAPPRDQPGDHRQEIEDVEHMAAVIAGRTVDADLSPGRDTVVEHAEEAPRDRRDTDQKKY